MGVEPFLLSSSLLGVLAQRLVRKLAFCARTGVLHEHGSPTRIHIWATNTRRRLRDAGEVASANDIVVVSGPLPVDEINKCLQIEGYCQQLLRRLSTLPHGKRLAQ
jgi:type II secretory ATPase GspE/PulE/Tfp pilus assembly ATPase PilB-like protein